MALKEYLMEINMCDGCNFCKFVPWQVMKSHRYCQVCPSIAYSNFHAYSAAGRLGMSKAIIQGIVKEYTPESRKAIFQCQLCGACQVSCRPVNWYLTDLVDIMEELRFDAVEKAGPLPAHKELAATIENHGNPYGEPLDKRFSFIPKGVKTAERADLLYWAGCTPAYRQSNIGASTVKVLSALGQDFAVLGEKELCCGVPIWKSGQRKRAEKFMERNLRAIEASGAKRIIVNCADCYGAFKVEYPKAGFDLPVEVISFAELMDEKLKKGKLKFKNEVPLKAVYHDPCNLGRNSEPYVRWEGEFEWAAPHDLVAVPEKPKRFGAKGCYQPPRDVLTAVPGLELYEFERNRWHAWCCGGGIECKEAFPEFTAWTASERIEEAREIEGLEAIISHCPHCSENFKSAVKAAGEKMKIMDLSEVVAEGLGV
jgi:Fe-S oxidoreductase